MDTLTKLLSRAYQAQNGLSKESFEDVLADYDQSLNADATALLTTLTDELCARDYISKQHRNFLRLALGVT